MMIHDDFAYISWLVNKMTSKYVQGVVGTKGFTLVREGDFLRSPGGVSKCFWRSREVLGAASHGCFF